MVHHTHPLFKCLLLISLLLLGLAFSVAVGADDSAGIHLGTHRFVATPDAQSSSGSSHPFLGTQPAKIRLSTDKATDKHATQPSSRVIGHRYHSDKPHSRNHDDHNARHQHRPRVIYSSPVYWVTPGYYVESQPYAPSQANTVTHLTGYSDSPVIYRRHEEKQNKFTNVDPWAALGNYQVSRALDVFAWQLEDRPYAVLPKVGYALTVALAGELEQGAELMQQALSGNVSELNYFRSSDDLNLIIEELLLSYQQDALMTSSLLYLRQHYQAADQAVNQAIVDCNNCTSARQLQNLIHRQL